MAKVLVDEEGCGASVEQRGVFVVGGESLVTSYAPRGTQH